MRYNDLKSREPDNAAACNAILDGLEMRWANADQDVFIAAVLLNPIHKAAPFVKSIKCTPAAIYPLFSRLWTRFYNESIPHEFFQELKDYFEGSGVYEVFKTYIPALQRRVATEQVSGKRKGSVSYLTNISVSKRVKLSTPSTVTTV
jgi:hypothetical protein